MDSERGCRPAVRRRVPRLAAAVTVTAVLAACQTGGPQALSLEEAKRVTAGFSGSFTPPPRIYERHHMARVDESRSSGELLTVNWIPPQTRRGHPGEGP